MTWLQKLARGVPLEPLRAYISLLAKVAALVPYIAPASLKTMVQGFDRRRNALVTSLFSALIFIDEVCLPRFDRLVSY